MNEHHQIETLSAYLDGELDAAEKRRVEDHLAGCEECTRASHSLRSAALAVLGLAPVTPTADESRAVRLAVLQAAGKRLSRFTPARLAGVLGAMVLLGAGVLGLSLMGEEPRLGGSNLAGREASTDAPTSVVTEQNFNSPEEILAMIESDPALVAGAARYQVSDIGGMQESQLQKTTVQGEEAESSGSQAATPVQTPLWGCQKKVLQSKPYPTMPLAARPAVYQGEKAWLLVFAFSYSSEEGQSLDRIRVQLVRRDDCHLLVEQVFKP